MMIADRRIEMGAAVLLLFVALDVFGKSNAPAVVCTTCNDKGLVTVACPVCRGTRYVWKCVPSKNQPQPQETWRYDENGNYVRVDPNEGWCGFGATYKPLHTNCKCTRKRLVCPNCATRSKTTATGKVKEECPDCNGKGVLVKTYRLVRDVRELAANREFVLRQLERGANCPYVQTRKLSKDELADYKIENPNCKVFKSNEALLGFLKNGEDPEASGKWYFAIRDITNVTLHDKRLALEYVVNGSGSCGGSNVLKRKFSDEEVKDFLALNPNSKMFRDVDEFKSFVRSVKAVAEAEPERCTVSPEALTATPEERTAPPVERTMSPEELKKLIDAENRHDKEMLERKLKGN